MRKAREREQPEDQSRDWGGVRGKHMFQKNVKEKKSWDMLEASGKGVSLKGEAINL